MKNRSLRLLFAAALVSASTLLRAAENPTQPIPEVLDLPTSVKFALDNNFAIRQARERILQQEGVEIEVRSAQLPTVSTGASYSFNDEEISTSFPATDRTWGISLVARQTVYAGGGVSASIRASRLTREAAVLELQGIINEQLLLVRTKYYNVLLNKQRVVVQKENVGLLEEQLRDAKNRFEAGATSNFEVLRAEVALANGRPPLIQSRNDFRLSIEELRQALGFTTRDAKNLVKIPEFSGDLEVKASALVSLPDALASARENRPELQRIAKLSEAGEQNVKAARSAKLPTVEVYGRYDFARGTPSSSWDDRRDGWTAGVQAQWNVFDGRARSGRIAQAKSRLNQTRLTLEEVALAIDVDVRRAHSSLQEAWELVESTGKVVSQADEALRLANVRYTAGSATQLDVLTSQVSLTEAKLNQLTAFHHYNVALAALNTAIGKSDSFLTK